VRFGKVTIKTDPEHHAFEVELFIGELDPNSIQVEIYADGDTPFLQQMKRCRQLERTGYAYCGVAPAARASGDYTVRVVPNFNGAAIPLEASQILWQRR
jgi:starch phosphorylase